MAMVRAKYRCMALTQHYDGHTTATFRPVYRNSKQGPDEENKLFSLETPSGEAELNYTECPADLKAGDFYYIDMEKCTGEECPQAWTITGTERQAGWNNTKITLALPWQYSSANPRCGSVQLGITRQETADLFTPFGSKWKVTFSFAEKSAD